MSILWNIIKLIIIASVIFFGGVFILGWIVCGGGPESGPIIFGLVLLTVLVKGLMSILFRKDKKNNGNEIVVKSPMANYIRLSRRKGLSDDEILNNLVNEGGWDREEVLRELNNNE